MKQNYRIYISGPITGHDDYLTRFERVEEALSVHWDVLNPAKVCADLPPLEWEEYMKICLPMLRLADAIYLLEGWEDSRGARIEYRLAKKLDLEIIREGQ